MTWMTKYPSTSRTRSCVASWTFLHGLWHGAPPDVRSVHRGVSCALNVVFPLGVLGAKSDHRNAGKDVQNGLCDEGGDILRGKEDYTEHYRVVFRVHHDA